MQSEGTKQLEEMNEAWFLYIGDQLVGPCSALEARGIVNQEGDLQPVFAWKQGVVDWRRLRTTQEFDSLLSSKTEVSLLSFQTGMPDFVESSIQESTGPSTAKGTSLRNMSLRTRVGVFAISLVTLVLVVSTIDGFQLPFGTDPSTRGASSLESPRILDVTAEDYAAMRAVVDSKSSVPKAKVALSQLSQLQPVFFVASNLPDGSFVDLYLNSISGKVLGDKTVALKARIALVGGVGKTPALVDEVGSLLPKGEYQVRIHCQDCLKNLNSAALRELSPRLDARGLLIDQDQVFIGGERDPAYNEFIRSREEHRRERGRLELMELRQITGVLLQEVRAKLDGKPGTKTEILQQMYSLLNQAQGTVIYPEAYGALSKFATSMRADSTKARLQFLWTDLQYVNAKLKAVDLALQKGDALPDQLLF